MNHIDKRRSARLFGVLLIMLTTAARSDNENRDGEHNDDDEHDKRTVSLACSISQGGKAVINEVNTGADFIELYLMQAANIKNWALYVDEKKIKTLGYGDCAVNGTTVKDNNGDVTTFPAGTFIYCRYNMNPSNNEVLLVDKSSDLESGNKTVIDYLSYGTPSPQARWSVPASCGTLYPGHNASNKDIARLPDGTGALLDNDDASTPGYSNVTSAVVNNPANFTCVEPQNSSSNGSLYTKLVGTAFSFDVIALKSDGSVQTTYAGTANKHVTVELVDGSDGIACANRQAVSPAISQSMTFTAADKGRKPAPSFTLSEAYSNLRCRVTDANQTQSVIGCSSDSFAVRPTAFSVTSSADGGATVKAGAGFSLTAASGVAGYDGTPKLDAAKVNAHSGAVATGTLAGAFGGADVSTGAAGGSSFTYSEVGWFSLAAQGVYDDQFTAVDSAAGDCSNDFSNSSIGGMFGCKFGNTAATASFGRFIPDHFDVGLNTPIFAPACSTFTYVGQPIKYATIPVATVTAKNMAGATTRNYTGSYWKIDPNHATYGIVPSYSDASQPLTVLNASAPAVADNGDGSGKLSFADTVSNILGVTRGNPVAPFNAEIAMSFSLIDTDGVRVANINGASGNNPVKFGAAGAGNGIAFSGNNKQQRWGRLVLGNAYGSELKTLAVPLFSEYYSGSAFVANSQDNCTTLALSSQLALSNPATASGAVQAGNASMAIGSGISQATLAHPVLVSGDAGLSFGSPGAGNTGYIDIKGNFNAQPWLLFDWDHNGVQDNSPSARASFGLYKGNSQQIYLREVY